MKTRLRRGRKVDRANKVHPPDQSRSEIALSCHVATHSPQLTRSAQDLLQGIGLEGGDE